MTLKFIFECDEDQIDLVKAIMENEFHIKIKPVVAAGVRHRYHGRNDPRGEGFGDKVWRICDSQVQASFAKPCAESYFLKHHGFKWCNKGAYWYNDFNDGTVNVLLQVGLKQIVKEAS